MHRLEFSRSTRVIQRVELGNGILVSKLGLVSSTDVEPPVDLEPRREERQLDVELDSLLGSGLNLKPPQFVD